ncbi:DUF559 domain-containing protein [Mycolicibacterium neworleansense]|uniref:DUF559 domain-containing protein n=1 Tax=Mycolicibacterium neworleansense TaxID=146018 RepID=UPI000B817D1B|nr:DUF559 domain-containing protein [Mycolicibacterium neworleansense]MCV7361202.1 DUF559 domain-containing protein [Mycolicibacterium neworleansense]
MTTFDSPFVGSEALRAGLIRKHQLRANFRAVLPDVYVARDFSPGLVDRARAAWLWSHRQGVLAGLTAAALHGARWVDESAPIELIWGNARSPTGVWTSAKRLLSVEIGQVGGLPVTTAERTAFDIGRTPGAGRAVARLDSLARATGLKVGDVEEVAARHRGARGLRQLERVLPMVDAGSQSPKETWLRLLLIEHGLPRPQTQIPVIGANGYPFAYLDMGWTEWMVAVEYDGDQHRSDRTQYVKDIRRTAELERMGWIIVRVVAEDRPPEILRRVREAITRQTTLR